MNKLILSIVATASLWGSAAFAADMPVKAIPAPAPVTGWDWAFGGALMSDYNFRGISQSDRGASHTAYFETRYKVNDNWTFYAGSQYWGVDLPTHPSCECDFYGGVRPTFGPLAWDFGFIYYYYPRERQVFTDAAGAATFIPGTVWTLNNTDYWEVYGKVTWDVVANRFALGANVYYSPSWLHTGADGLYASATAKVTFQPFTVAAREVGWYISGEFGHYWLGTTTEYPAGLNFALVDYNTWNVGIAFTHKVFTLDLRYYDTDLTQAQCFTNTGDLRGLTGGTNPAGTSRWCSATFIVAGKIDITASEHLR